MKKLALIAVAVASLATLTACGESSSQIDPTHIIVADNDGKVDARQIQEACQSIGKRVDSWSKSALEISSDGEALVVTCR